jgi:heptosyltransferase-2
MRILIIALSGIGDALMFSPALDVLRRRHPDARIDLLAMFRGVEEIYARNPAVDRVIFHRFLNSRLWSSLRVVWRLRRERYDVSIMVYPANRWPYNVISFLIGARRRYGHTYRRVNGRSLNALNNVRITEDDEAHNVVENVRLVTALTGTTEETPGPLRLVVTDADRTRAREWLRRTGVREGIQVIGMHAGSAVLKNHTRRRWAPEKFAALASALSQRRGVAVLLFGGPDEYALNDDIARASGGSATAVKVGDLMTTAAIMERCAVIVSNDSALMHIASALQRPVVALFAYTNPRFVHPWNTEYRIVRKELDCSPCFFYSPRPARCKWREDKFRCITTIGVGEALNAVEELLPAH